MLPVPNWHCQDEMREDCTFPPTTGCRTSAGLDPVRRIVIKSLEKTALSVVLKEQRTIQIQGLGGKKKTPQPVLHQATE